MIMRQMTKKASNEFRLVCETPIAEEDVTTKYLSFWDYMHVHHLHVWPIPLDACDA